MSRRPLPATFERRLPSAVLAFLCLILAACEQPPAKEIAAAQASLEQARKDGAERFAPDRLKEAEAALAEAQHRVTEKDYRGALSSAAEASEKARGAAKAAGAAKTLARSGAELGQAQALARLEEAATVREEAREAKIPDEAFAEVAPLEEKLRAALAEVAAAVTRGNLLEAQQAATDLKDQAAPLPTLFREARAKWEAEHPKGKMRGRGAPPPRKNRRSR